MKNKALVKDYEKLADEFGQNLLTKLRQHSVDYGFLDYWVADNDIKKGLISMVESAKLSLYKEIEINFMKKSVSDKELVTLKENLKRYGKLTIFARQSKYVLIVKFLEQQEKNTKIFFNNTIKFKSKNINNDNVIKTEKFYLKSSFEKYINALKNTSNFMYSYDNCNQNEKSYIIGKYKDIKLYCKFNQKSEISNKLYFEKTHNDKLNFILNQICLISENLPIQEIFEHTVLKVVQNLEDKTFKFLNNKTLKNKGILLPKNCGSIFLDVQQALRQLYQEYLKLYKEEDKINFYYIKPKEKWNKLAKVEKINLLNNEIFNFVEKKGVNIDKYVELVDLKSNRYNYYTRCIIKFSKNIEPNKKPKILRELESFVREKIDPSLEIIAEKLKDTSPLRRL